MRRPQHPARPGPSTPSSPQPVALQRVLRKTVLGALLMTALAPAAHAQDATRAVSATHAYDVPAGPLAGALSRFAEQANILLSVPADMTAGKTSPGVRGAHNVDSAFRALLANTGLEGVRRAEGGYPLRPAPATSAMPASLFPIRTSAPTM